MVFSPLKYYQNVQGLLLCPILQNPQSSKKNEHEQPLTQKNEHKQPMRVDLTDSSNSYVNLGSLQSCFSCCWRTLLQGDR